MKNRTSFGSFLRFFKYAKKWRLKILLATIYSIINKIFDIAPEILLGIAVDVVVGFANPDYYNFLDWLGFHGAKQQVIILAFSTFGIWVFESIFQYLYMITWRNIAQSIEHEMRLDAYKNVQNLDAEWFESQKLGNIASILNDDVNQLERFLNNGANEIIQITVSSVFISLVFLYISPLIGIILTLPIPLILLISMFFQKNLSPRYSKVRESVGALSSSIFNNLLGIITIKSFASEDKENNRLNTLSHEYLNKNKKAISLSSAFVPVVRMGVLSGFLATMVLGSLKTMNGEIMPGSFAMLLFLSQRFLWPFTRLGETVDLFERSMASAKRILDILDVRPIIKNGSNIDFTEYYNDIIFKNVSFSYNQESNVFNNLNFKIKKGQFAGIVGSTGIGKTSLVKLLLRLYDPQKGDIFIGNENIKNLELQKLRKNIGLVSQDTYLFDGSIMENIIYPDNNIDLKKVEIVSKLSQASEFIENLPHKFDTLIGERGIKLSGGQKQRLAIARALYKNPSILIFDEATSSVDNNTEFLIQKSMKDICKNRTAIVIAHRLSTIRKADIIFILDNGCVQEKGTHDELLLKNGLYKKLWDIQTGNTVN
ncbi:MAG: ABC transporter [Candidatus Marinimicrobia bacterium]|nr:ABC transporter [Candidatus Neomarinimicrobiota bacterium]|tara:strand:+ start:2879 stop:4669 length:1791 start_codon:yes stop_codon:yes gene_type:complete